MQFLFHRSNITLNFKVILGVCFLLVSLQAAMGQTSPEKTMKKLLSKGDEASIEVMVLGVFHFTGTPSYNAIDNPEQQQELAQLIDALANFNPTKMALEYPLKERSRLDSLYQAYQNGRHELNNNERQQIGFRLAHRMDHQKVYAIDYKQPWGMREVMEWAKTNEPGFMDYFKDWRAQSGRIDSVLHQHYSISEILSYLASDDHLDRLQEARMRMLEVGAGQNYIGIKPVTSVFERNMRIFANLLDMAEPGDRIIIVYGAGHSYFFNEFIEQHADLKLVHPDEYLPETWDSPE